MKTDSTWIINYLGELTTRFRYPDSVGIEGSFYMDRCLTIELDRKRTGDCVEFIARKLKESRPICPDEFTL